MKKEITTNRNKEGLEKIFETVPIPISLVNKHGILVDCNYAVIKLHGYKTKEELIGKHTSILFPEFELKRIPQDTAKIISTGTANKLTYTLKRKDGTTFPAEITSAAYVDEVKNETFIVSYAFDITKRSKREAEVKKLNKNLDKKVEEQKENINQLKKAEKKINTLNHDLEHKIKERTQELEDKNSSLKRINKAFVGRELRMKELKTEIKNLKNK